MRQINSIQDDYNFLKGANDRISSLLEKNISGVRKFPRNVLEQMEEINLRICQIMDELDDKPLDPQLIDEWTGKILDWENQEGT
jgi:hypothetical protein